MSILKDTPHPPRMRTMPAIIVKVTASESTIQPRKTAITGLT